MNKKTIITILLTLVALAVQAKTFKTIKNPVIPATGVAVPSSASASVILTR